MALEMPVNHHIGTLIQNLQPEIDTDDEEQERTTPALSWGWLARRDDTNEQWAVYFPNGAAIWVTDEELADPQQYAIPPNQSLAFLTPTRPVDDGRLVLAGARHGVHFTLALSLNADSGLIDSQLWVDSDRPSDAHAAQVDPGDARLTSNDDLARAWRFGDLSTRVTEAYATRAEPQRDTHRERG